MCLRVYGRISLCINVPMSGSCRIAPVNNTRGAACSIQPSLDLKKKKKKKKRKKEGGGARGVMVIVVGSGHCYTSSNLGRN